jgi:thiol:disulfide interchange protein
MVWIGAAAAAGPKPSSPSARSRSAFRRGREDGRSAICHRQRLLPVPRKAAFQRGTRDSGGRRLPAGKIKTDEFFGKVETYRGQLAVKLALQQPAPGSKVVVRAESQGCADAGVCYPPQVQNVTVTLPLPGMRPEAPVAATPARKSWFN